MMIKHVERQPISVTRTVSTTSTLSSGSSDFVRWILVSTGPVSISSHGPSFTLDSGSFLLLPQEKELRIESHAKSVIHILTCSKSHLCKLMEKGGLTEGYARILDFEGKFSLAERVQKRIRFDAKRLLRFLDTLSNLESEILSLRKFSSNMRDLLFIQLLLHALRPGRPSPSAGERIPPKLKPALAHIHTHFNEEISLDQLAISTGYSTSQFLKAFQKAVGLSPKAYMRRLQIQESMRLLETSEENITAISYASGFPDSNYFSRQFKQVTGLSPLEYKNSIRSRASSKKIGLLLQFFTGMFKGDFHIRLLEGLFDMASKTDFDLTVIPLKQPLDYPNLKRLVEENNYSGIIVTNWGSMFAGFPIELLPEIPFVCLNSAPNIPFVSSVSFPNKEAGMEIAQYLAAKGHKKIGLWEGVSASSDNVQRVEGFVSGLKKRGISLPSKWKVNADFEEQKAYLMAKKILSQKPTPTAIFCCNDNMALGIMRASKELGFKVPEDLSLIGFDDIPAARKSSPPLTSYRQDPATLGKMLVENMTQWLMTGKNPGHWKIPGKLVERKSVKRI